MICITNLNINVCVCVCACVVRCLCWLLSVVSKLNVFFFSFIFGTLALMPHLKSETFVSCFIWSWRLLFFYLFPVTISSVLAKHIHTTTATGLMNHRLLLLENHWTAFEQPTDPPTDFNNRIVDEGKSKTSQNDQQKKRTKITQRNFYLLLTACNEFQMIESNAHYFYDQSSQQPKIMLNAYTPWHNTTNATQPLAIPQFFFVCIFSLFSFFFSIQ